MKTYKLFVMAILAMSVLSSCSKDKETSELITSEGKIGPHTGLSFISSADFEADHVIFKLRYGSNMDQEYGQSLEDFSYTKLQAGPKTLYQIQVYTNGKQTPFSAFSKDAEGTKIEIKSTSVIEIKEDEMYKIYLEGSDN